MTKADHARQLLAAGKSVADAARESGAHYSQVHGIAKKMALTTAVVKKTPKGGKRKTDTSKAMVTKDQPKRGKVEVAPSKDLHKAACFGPTKDDVAAEKCERCKKLTFNRVVTYRGKTYGTAHIHGEPTK